MANAQATSTSTTAVQEVVVTARARQEKLQQVPISVQAFTAATLAENNITDLSTLQSEAGFIFNSQGASYNGGGRQFPTLVFRGLTTNYGGAQGGSSGALFVDGIYISGGLASVTLADASNVEVLKGPQSVYFGKNTFGGAVNLITSNPSEEYHAKASVGYSDKGSYDDVGSVEGAIIPGLLTARITGELYHQGAQYKAADGGPLGEEDTKGVTVVLYATPTPDVWLRTRFHYSHDDDSTAADGFIGGAVYGTACPGMVNPYFCSSIPTLSSINPKSVLSGTIVTPGILTAIANNNFNGFPQQWQSKVPRISHTGLERDNLQGSVAGGIKLPYDASFQFSAGYNQAAADDLTAADHTPNPFFVTNNDTINRDFQADARVLSSPSQPLRAVLGASYFRSVNQLSNGGAFFTGIYSAFGGYEDAYDQTEAAYGSLDYDILPNLTVTGEARYQRDTIVDVQPPLVLSKGENHWLPRAIVTYKPEKNTTVYLSYSVGVQDPQFQYSLTNGLLAQAAGGPAYETNAIKAFGITNPITADPTNRVWEIGWKQSLFDNRVVFSVDYYNMFWDKSLVNTFLFDPSGCLATYGGPYKYYPGNTYSDCPLGSTGGSITNTSNDHIQGIEFDGTARVTDKLTAHLAFNWTDAIRTEYSDQSWGGAFTSGVVPSQDGKRVNLFPEYQASLDGTYKDHLVGPYDWYAHGLVTYTGPQYVEATDIAQLNGYFHVNLSAGITKGNLTFEAFVTNLLDDKNWTMAVRFPENPATFSFSEAQQGLLVTAPNPRDFGFKISAKY
jgi:iron complex outermembrane receptor protein